MSARARHRAREDARNIELRLEDDSMLDEMPAQSVDHVVGTLALCSVHDPLQTLARIDRVLRRDGTYVFIEHVRDEGWKATVQDHLTPLWTHLFGNCHLNRDFQRSLLEGGFRLLQRSTRSMPFPFGRIVYGVAAPAIRQGEYASRMTQ